MGARGQRKTGGRTAKCTPEVRKRVCAAILKGAGREDAADAAGVCRATLQRWLAEGAKHETGLYRDFLDAVEGAESQLVRKAGAVVVDLLSKKTPAAVRFASAKLILERRRRDVWGPKAEVAVSGPEGGAVQVAAAVEHSGTVEHEHTTDIPWEKLGELSLEQLEAMARGLKG